MTALSAHAGAILVVTGAITAGASAAAVAPAVILKLLFGATALDRLTVMVARHWGLLVGLVGCLLVYAAFHPEVRLPVMVAAIAEKLAIGALIFISPWRSRPWAALVAGTDTAIALVYIAILVGGGSA